MSESNDKLHLWFKPYDGVLNDRDMAFVDSYSRRYYPKTMSEVARQLHRLSARVTRMCPPGMFEYHMTHMTRKASKRYVIEEYLRDLKDNEGLNFGIQATTQEERELFAKCLDNESTTQPVQNIIAYMEDAILTDPKWQSIKMANKLDAMPVLHEILGFLKAVKSQVRVHTFEVNHRPEGIVMTVALLSPGVLSYYVRVDWTIR